MISVLLADDHPQITKSLKYLLETSGDIKVVATAKNGVEAVADAQRYYPDVAVLDINMPVMDGIETTRQIRTSSRITRVVILSFSDVPKLVKAALDAGASAYVLKDFIASDLVTAIRAAHKGTRYFSRRIAEIARQHIEQSGSVDVPGAEPR